jgi:23S rRNA (adenine-N6)-dimethyltransferase
VAGRGPRSERDARRRAHSQNFLHSSAVASELVADAEIVESDLVVDIGAGSGVLTAALANAARKVVAIEVDPALASGLRERFSRDTRVTVLEADALAVPLPGEPFRVLASLPFAKTTPILRRLLDDPGAGPARADVIVQWEAGVKRIQTPPRNVLTIQWSPWWRFSVTRRVAAECFRPIPAVDAAFVSIRRRSEPLLDPAQRDAFSAFVRRAFERVQVPLVRTLASDASPHHVRRAIARVGAHRDARPSDLASHQWVRLFRALPAGRE